MPTPRSSWSTTAATAIRPWTCTAPSWRGCGSGPTRPRRSGERGTGAPGCERGCPVHLPAIPAPQTDRGWPDLLGRQVEGQAGRRRHPRDGPARRRLQLRRATGPGLPHPADQQDGLVPVRPDHRRTNPYRTMEEGRKVTPRETLRIMFRSRWNKIYYLVMVLLTLVALMTSTLGALLLAAVTATVFVIEYRVTRLVGDDDEHL